MELKLIDLHFQGHELSIGSYLLEDAGSLALIETGPYSTVQSLLDGIAAAGFRPEDVKQVFLTHIHLDHAGAAWYFARLGAQIYVHPAGQKHLVDPSRLYNSAKMIYQDKMDALWGAMNEIDPARVTSVAQGEKIPFGNSFITAWHTPGHAVHHIAWQCGKELFTGDVAGVKVGEFPVVPPCPPPDINIEDWLDSIELMRKLPVDTLRLTHFGAVHDIENHFDILSEKLKTWSACMKPFADQGVPQEDVVPQFMEFTKNDLLEGGATPEIIAVYELANPSWMGVAGLMRYWQKKAKSDGAAH